MTTSVPSATSADTSAPSFSPGSPVAGLWPLLRFMLRRERVGIPIWALGAAALYGAQVSQSIQFADDPAALANLRATFDNPAARILTGPIELVQSPGGEAVFEVAAYVATVAALGAMFLVGRLTRADEQTGRAEVVRSAPTGRDAPLTAAVIVSAVLSLIMGLSVFVVGIAFGLPAGGSALFGAATTGVGLTFAGFTVVGAQIFDSTRAVYGAIGLVLAVSWVLRAVGDVNGGPWAWLSPIGWAQRTYPYTDLQQWWPLLLPVATFAVGVVAAFALAERRDFGAGFVSDRPGRANASWTLGSAAGLAWRLQRGGLYGWLVGAGGLGLALGSFAPLIEDFIEDTPELADVLPGGPTQLVDAYLSIAVTLVAVLATAYGVGAVLRGRGEETADRAEPVLAAAVSRWEWMGSHLLVAGAGSATLLALGGLGTGISYTSAVADDDRIVALTVDTLTYLPAVAVVVALTTLLVGAVPRLASPVSWAVVAFIGFVTFFGESLDLPEWLRGLSPIDQIGTVPLEEPDRTALVVLSVAAVAALVAGLVAFRRRDVPSR